jgi:hypothetical protein
MSSELKRPLKVLGIFLLQFATLWIAETVIGNQLSDVCILSNHATIVLRHVSCDDNMLCFGRIIALSITGILYACLLLLKPSQNSTIWSLVASLAILDATTVTHMRGPGCM